MKKFYKKNKKLVGIIFLLSAVSFFVFWEFVGRSELLHQKVIVLNTDVYKGTEITADMIKTSKMDVNNCIINAVSDRNDILGLEAKHYIPANAQLVEEYFDLSELVLNDNEKIMKLPDEWIHSYPETLRRRDKVYLYAIKGKDDLSDAQEVISDNSEPKEKLYVFNTTVAYVKDNANREVESLDADRLTGSSVVSVVEIIITDEEFEILKKYAGNGYTFALLYE